MMPRARSMSVEEVKIAALQNRLHEENARRFQQIEKNQDNQAQMLAEILRNTASLPELKKTVEHLEAKVEVHERDITLVKGGGAVVTFLIASWEFIRFAVLKR